MNKKLWAAMFLLGLLGMLAGCSKKENTNEEQGTSPSSDVKPAPAATPIDPATVASVSGTVTFGGTAPKNVAAQAKAWLKRLQKERNLG